MPCRPSLTLRILASLSLAVAAIAAGCNTTNGYVANQQGVGFYNQGNYTAARHEFQRAALDNPGNANYLHNLAMAMGKQGDAYNAERMYRKALSVDPAHQPSYHHLAEMMNAQGRQAEAMQLVQMYAGTQPYSPAANVEMAALQRQTGDYSGAEQSLRQALQHHPNHPAALAHLGQLYQDTNRSREAMAYYQRSLAVNWNQPQLHSRMAAMQPVSNYRMNERLAARPQRMGGSPLYAAGPIPVVTAQAVPGPYGWQSAPVAMGIPTYSGATAYASPMYAPPNYVTVPQPTYALSPTPLGPTPVAQQPVRLVTPLPNADPAHAPTSTAVVPEVQPY